MKQNDISKKDKHWLEQLRVGKEEGLKGIFDQYYPYLLTTASHYLSDQEQAKDVVQEVFVELWKKGTQLNIQTSLQAYLRRAVVNRSLNQIKSQKRYIWNDEHPDLNTNDHSISAQKKLELEDLQSVIDFAIEALPERCRLIFTMSRMEDMSHKEIAEKLDISTKTIENQMTKALKSIRSAVGQFGMNPFLLLLSYFLMF